MDEEFEGSNQDDSTTLIESDILPPTIKEQATLSQELPSNIVSVDYDNFYDPGGYYISISNIDYDKSIEIIPRNDSINGADKCTTKETNIFNYREYFEMNHFYDSAKGYDDNDPFIDNDDAYDDVMNPYFDTEYGGFYINNGVLILKNVQSNEITSEKGSKKHRKHKKKTHTIDENDNTTSTDNVTPTKKLNKTKKSTDHIDNITIIDSNDENDKKIQRKRKIKTNDDTTISTIVGVNTNKPTISKISLDDDTDEKIATNQTEINITKDRINNFRSITNNPDIKVELPDFLPADHKNSIMEIVEIIKNIPETFNDPEFNTKWIAFCSLLQNNITKSKTSIIRYIVSKTGISKGTLLLQISKCLTDDIVIDIRIHFEAIEKIVNSIDKPTINNTLSALLDSEDYYLLIEDFNRIASVTKLCGKYSPSIDTENEYIEKLTNLCPENISKNEFFVNLYSYSTLRKNKLKKFKSIQFLKNLAFKYGATTDDITTKIESLTNRYTQSPSSSKSVPNTTNIVAPQVNVNTPCAIQYNSTQYPNNKPSYDASKKSIAVIMPNRQIVMTTADELKKITKTTGGLQSNTQNSNIIATTLSHNQNNVFENNILRPNNSNIYVKTDIPSVIQLPVHCVGPNTYNQKLTFPALHTSDTISSDRKSYPKNNSQHGRSECNPQPPPLEVTTPSSRIFIPMSMNLPQSNMYMENSKFDNNSRRL